MKFTHFEVKIQQHKMGRSYPEYNTST